MSPLSAAEGYSSPLSVPKLARTPPFPRAVKLPSGHKVVGYQTYPKTLEGHSAEEQRGNTLLITNAWLKEVREAVDGFKDIETFLQGW